MRIFYDNRAMNGREKVLYLLSCFAFNVVLALTGLSEWVQTGLIFLYLVAVGMILTRKKRPLAILTSASALLLEIELSGLFLLIELLTGLNRYKFTIADEKKTIIELLSDPLLLVILLLALRIMKPHEGMLRLTKGEAIILTLLGIFTPMMEEGVRVFSYELDNYPFSLGWVLFIFVLNFAVFYAVIYRSRARYYRSLGDDYKDSFQKEAAYLQDYKKERKEADKFNHDMKNHMLILQGFLENGEYDKAVEYFRTLSQKQSLGEKRVLTGNATLDMLLQMKQDTLAAEQIELRYNGGLEGLSFMSDIDVCVIFSNLLDNAIEANLKCDGGRFVEIKAVSSGDVLMCKISNRMNGKLGLENGRLISDKSTGIHGFGIENVKRVIEEYEGTYKIKTDSDIFSFQITFNAK